MIIIIYIYIIYTLYIYLCNIHIRIIHIYMYIYIYICAQVINLPFSMSLQVLMLEETMFLFGRGSPKVAQKYYIQSCINNNNRTKNTIIVNSFY